MKKLPALFSAIAFSIISISCLHSDGNTSLSYHDSDNYYSLKACFNKMKTRDVDDYMDRRIGRRSNISFANMQSYSTLTLDDNTKLHIKKYPGFIEIKLDKEKNSDEAYFRIKSMCEGIKKILIQK